MNGLRTLGCVVAILSLSACASMSGTDQLRGTSGPMAWEVVDVRQARSPDGRVIRWYYTLVLRETAGRAIQFERVQSNLIGQVEGIPLESKFERRLNAHSELRFSNQSATVWDLRLGPPSITVFQRYFGKDDAGAPLSVDVRIPLDSSVGKTLAEPVQGPLPPVRTLQPTELGSLAGRWDGYHHDDRGFAIPLDVTIKEDGSFEASSEPPWSYRFRGTVAIRDGQVAYSQRNDSGVLVLYEGSGQRILQGNVSGRREGLPDRSGAAPYQINYRLRLEQAAVSTEVTLPAPAPSTPQTTPIPAVTAFAWRIGDEWSFRWESPRGKGTFTWVVTPATEVEGVPSYVVRSGSREIVYTKRPEGLSWREDKVDGVAVERASPAALYYSSPLYVGKVWEIIYTWEGVQARQTEELTRRCTVEGVESVRVPAGTFDTYRVACTTRWGEPVRIYWYSESVRMFVKEEVHFSYGVRIRELMSYKMD